MNILVTGDASSIGANFIHYTLKKLLDMPYMTYGV